MNTNFDFQMVCASCGSLAIKIEDPERASREAIVSCGDCGASRGTMGALRDLAVLPNAIALQPTKQPVPKAKIRSELVARYSEVQSLRRKVQIAEARRK